MVPTAVPVASAIASRGDADEQAQQAGEDRREHVAALVVGAEQVERPSKPRARGGSMLSITESWPRS